MTKATLLETDRLILRALSMEHLSQNYVDWLNDPEIYKYLESNGGYTIDLLENFLKEVESKNIYFLHLTNWGRHCVLSDNFSRHFSITDWRAAVSESSVAT